MSTRALEAFGRLMDDEHHYDGPDEWEADMQAVRAALESQGEPTYYTVERLVAGEWETTNHLSRFRPWIPDSTSYRVVGLFAHPIEKEEG